MKPEAGKRLGIIGGGQLGGFLCQAARGLDVHTTVLTPSQNNVACRHADAALIASLDDLSAVARLAETVDVITFELEDVPVATLKYLAAQTKARVYPEPDTLLLIQNKARQKAWLRDNAFPTSAFLTFDRGIDGAAATEMFGPDFILKTQRGGYDGLGVHCVRNGLIPPRYQNVPVIAEARVQNFTEIAVLAVRDASGSATSYPVFQSTFDAQGNVLRRVLCPAPIDPRMARQATSLAHEIVNRLQGVGVFAVEYFLVGGDLLVNEIAPRVHNVGHLTLEACDVCQFEQHVRAVMSLGLAPVGQARAAIMENLLYEPDLADACRDEPAAEYAQVHWYGKSSPRPLRKMGHLTATGKDLARAGNLADRALLALKHAKPERNYA